MSILNREKLLAKERLELRKVDLGNGEFVYVRQMTGRERDNFEQSLVKEIKDGKGVMQGYEKSLEDFRAKLAVCTVCDETGDLILGFKDYTVLSKNMSAARLEAIVEVAQELNSITSKDREDLVKNSDAAPSGNSTSDSAKS